MSAAHRRPYVRPLPVDDDSFPQSTLTSPGMRTLTADPAPRHGTAVLGVEYARKSGVPLHLQVLLPPLERGSSARFPLVVFVQGSAWMSQELGLNLPALAEFARRGYVVAIVEYRPSSVAAFPAQVKDTATAIRFLRRNAERFHVDPARIALWGDSSGAHTALIMYATAGDPSDSDESDEPEPLGVGCFVDFYGPTDFARMNEEPSVQDHLSADSPEGRVLGGVPVLSDPRLLAAATVAGRLGADPRRAPLLMVHGTGDRVVPFGQSVILHDELRAAGQDVTFYRLLGADHGGAPFWQDEILDVVDTFLRTHLEIR